MAKTTKKKTQINLINGTNDNDIISGGKNNDYIYGGDGDDEIYGGKGNDNLFGGDGNDEIYGENGNDTIFGGRGNDKIYGGKGNDTIYGGDGDDEIQGEKGNDTIYTGSGNNTVYIHKGDGHDTIYHQGEKTSIAFDDFNEFDSNISFNKNNNDLDMIYSHTDKTKEIITIKDYFTSDGKVASEGIYIQTEPVMALPMYAVPAFPVQEFIIEEQPCLKYAPPPYINIGDDEIQTEIQQFYAISMYAVPPINDFIRPIDPEDGSTDPTIEPIVAPIDIPVLKYASPIIYGYTRSEIDLSNLLSLKGLTINAKKPGEYYGSEFDDTIKGSKGADTIIAGDGNDEIYAGKGNDKINAGDGINILYFSKNDGKNTVFDGGGTDILIVKNDKFKNLKVRFSGNDVILKYTGGQIILKDYQNGNHSAQYIQFGNERKAIADILTEYQKTKTINSDSSLNSADTSLIQSNASEWSATDVSAPESVYASEQTPDNIDAVLGIDNLNK